jgi:50S ribosomal protein L16 3-hydroxylase
MPRSVLGKLKVRRFLETYWQKEPLVVRGAFPDLRDPLTPDELAGLACEPSVNSRLVRERAGRKPWQVTRGPQRAAVLRGLSSSHWTLLVESMDRHSDEIAALAHQFSFLPRWRMDDVMVSLAPLAGTVEAHIDSYDVFLIQGQGRRRWDVDRRATADYRPGLDLRILKKFRPEQSWVLEPGDMLYVPPGVGHRGVTEPGSSKIALTYSIGFRAPSSADLLSSLLSRVVARDGPRLFQDAGRPEAKDPTEIAAPDLLALKRFLTEEVGSADPDEWAQAVGEAVTEGGSGRPRRGSLSVSTITRELAAGARLAPVPAARLSWCRLRGGRAALFVNGESRVLPPAHAFAAPFLCGGVSRGGGRRLGAVPELVLLVAELLRAGVVVLKGRASRREQ